MADRHIASGYIYSLAELPGVVAPNNYISLFNPIGATRVAVLSGIFVSYSLAIGTSITTPMRGYRVSTASGGTSVDTTEVAGNVAKVQTSYPDPVVEIRKDNPTVTLGPALFNSPPPTQKDTNFVHDINLPSGLLPFTLRPGEGIVLRTEASLTDAFWNLTLVWAEQGRR